MVSGANIWCSENISGAYKVSGAAALSRTLIQWWFARSAAPSQPFLHNTDPPTCPSLSLLHTLHMHSCTLYSLLSYKAKPPTVCSRHSTRTCIGTIFCASLLSGLVPSSAGCTEIVLMYILCICVFVTLLVLRVFVLECCSCCVFSQLVLFRICPVCVQYLSCEYLSSSICDRQVGAVRAL